MKHGEARVIKTAKGEEEIRRGIEFSEKQLNALPGPKEQKFLVVVKTAGAFYSYPVYYAPGFTEALQHALMQHKGLFSAQTIVGAITIGSSGKSVQYPDYMVQMMAMGAKVLLTGRMSND